MKTCFEGSYIKSRSKTTYWSTLIGDQG